jgi:hypothetical protein
MVLPLIVELAEASESTASVEIYAETNVRVAAATRTSRRSLRVFHLSDSHVTLETGSYKAEREGLGLGPDDAIADAYTAAKGFDAPGLFEAQVAAAVSAGAECLIHTGDFLNVPDPETIAWVTEVLENSGLPYMFTSGNHDWCFEGLGGDRRSMSSEEGRQAVRAEWRERRLLGLFEEGADPGMWSREFGGAPAKSNGQTAAQKSPGRSGGAC